jgi:hypothetical protein
MIVLLLCAVAQAGDVSLEAENAALREAVQARALESDALRAEGSELRGALDAKHVQIEAMWYQLQFKDEYVESLTKQLLAERQYSTTLENRSQDRVVPVWAQITVGASVALLAGYALHDVVARE